MIDNLFFGLRKAFRFAGIYGWRRTIFKVVGRLRTGNLRWLGRLWRTGAQDVGLIGCGQFGLASIGYTLLTHRGRCIASCFDTNHQTAHSFANALAVPTVALTATELINDPTIRVVYIASNHYSHTDYALSAMAAGKAVYVEKPVSVTQQQLASLAAKRRENSIQLFAGYNRPFSGAVRDLRPWCLDLTGPFTLSCFVSGHQLQPDHWYRDPKEGTRVCGNIGHWLDLAVHLLSWNSLPDSWRIVVAWSDPKVRDDDLAITLTSERGDLISIVLTARTEPFEGINETISVQWGDTIAKIDDFRRMTIWKKDKLRNYRYRQKDVGHVLAIMQPFSDKVRNFEEVEMSTLLMLEIADMVISGDRDRKFSFLNAWSRAGLPSETEQSA
jgi:predicted dehydrogenase